MASNIGMEAPDGYIEGPHLLQRDGLRFSQGFKSVTMLATMMEEHFKSEDRTAHVLQDYSCDWTKKLADVSSTGNRDFEHTSIYAAITKGLMEPIEDAKIYNLVKNDGLGNDGPVTFLRSWKAKMERNHIPEDTIQLYSTAMEKQESIEQEIKMAMEYYHQRKYKLEIGVRQLHAKPAVLSSRANTRLRKSMYRFLCKCEDAQEEYKKLLKMEEEGRGQYIADIRRAQRKFERFEKNRMMNIVIGIEKYLDILEKMDTERASHQGLICDIHGLLDNMDIEAGAKNIEAQYMNRHEFPVFVEFDENTRKQKAKKKAQWLKRLKMWMRKKNEHSESSSVIRAHESDPDLVKEIIISDDDSDDIKDISTSDNNTGEDSDIEIFEMDERGREIKVKHKLQKNPNIYALGKEEKLTNRNSFMVKAAPTTKHFRLPNATESDSETEMWAIPQKNLTVDYDFDGDTLPVPPKLKKMATKVVKKTGKEPEIIASESAENIKSTKISRKVKDKGQTEVKIKRRKIKDKVQETISVKSSDSDTVTEVQDLAKVRTLANVKVIAIEDYTAQNRDELTLKAGQKIRQKIPANSDGMAYGWIRKGKLRRKIYGYYPANLVELKPNRGKTGIHGLLSKKREILKFVS